ncbi:MAG: YhgE/Pip domain-containing protein [Massilioclostridium sp.]|nr:MAG: YhgE/Pip domain-containing protein [Massilioclostridium sp.]
MKTILHIFLRDLKRLRHNVIALIVVVGVCVIPALYAWFNIAANWDPYGSTNGISVAVASEDTGSTVETISVNLGSQIIEQLKSNDDIGWKFVDSEQAIEGVKKGDYYAAIVIPSHFSEDMVSFLTTDITTPKLEYYINEKKNAIAPKITNAGASTVQQQINQTFIQTAAEVIGNVLNTTSAVIDEDGQTVMDHFLTILQTVDNDLTLYDNTVTALSDTTTAVQGIVDSAKLTLPDVSSMASDGQAATNDIQSLISAAQQNSQGTSETIGNIFTAVNQMLDSVDQSIDSLPNLDTTQAKAELEHIQKQASSIMEINSKVLSVLTQIQQKLPILSDAIQPLVNKINSTNQSLQSIVDNINTIITSGEDLQTALANAQTNLKQWIASGKSDLQSVQNEYTTTVRPTLDSTMSSTYSALQSLSSLLGTAGSSIQNIDGILDGVNQAITSGNSALQNTSAIIKTTQEKIHNLRTTLENTSDNEQIEKLLELLQQDPSMLGGFMASPVQLETNQLYPIENYGSAMAPFYSTLAIWVGGIVLVAIMKVTVDEDKRLGNIKPYQAYIGRYLLFMLLGLVQATIICLGDLYFLKIQCLHPMLFMISGWISSLVFTNIIYTLTVSFGDIGKALSVIILVIQIAGSSGTFPIEVTPKFFQNVYPFLPFTYAINAMRETIAGFYGNQYLIYLLQVLAFLPFALLLGLVLRRPLIKFNRFFDERLEDTHLM